MNLYIPLAARRRRKGGGGGPPPPDPLDFVRSNLDWLTATFTITGGVAPYEIETFGQPWTPVVGGTADITFTFFDIQTVRVRDAAATVVELETLICPPPPTTWVPVSVGALPAVNGAERVIAFRDTNRGASAGLQIVNTTTGAAEVIQAFNEDGTPQVQAGAVRAHFASVALGAVRRVYFARFTSRNVFGYEVTSPATFPIAGVEPKEQLTLPLPPGTNMRGLIDDLQHLPTLEFLNNVMGKSNQAAAPWPLNSSMDTVTNVPSGGALAEAYWSGVDWRAGRAPTPTLDDQVAAILFGTTGFALDPQDLTTLSQNIAGTTPVTADGQPIGRFASKWGTAPEVWTSLNDGAARPVLGSGGLLYDGVDDFLQNSPNNIFRNVPAMFACMRMAMSDMGGSTERTILTFSNTTTGSIRFVPRTTSGFGLILRSAGPGAETQANSAAGLLTDNTPAVLSFLADYATGGRNRVWINGTQVADVASVAAGGPTLDQDSAIGRIMRASTASFPGFGKIGRMVFCPFTPTPAQRAVLEAWVSSGPFDPPGPPPPTAVDQWVLPNDFTSLPPNDGVVAHNGQNWKNIIASGNLGEPGIFYGWEAEP